MPSYVEERETMKAHARMATRAAAIRVGEEDLLEDAACERLLIAQFRSFKVLCAALLEDEEEGGPMAEIVQGKIEEFFIILGGGRGSDGEKLICRLLNNDDGADERMQDI
jgi:hypothetical protein